MADDEAEFTRRPARRCKKPSPRFTSSALIEDFFFLSVSIGLMSMMLGSGASHKYTQAIPRVFLCHIHQILGKFVKLALKDERHETAGAAIWCQMNVL